MSDKIDKADIVTLTRARLHRFSPVEIFQLDKQQCRIAWRMLLRVPPMKHASLLLMRRVIAYEIQCHQYGGLSRVAKNRLKSQSTHRKKLSTNLPIGTVLIRERHGKKHIVNVQEDGFLYNGQIYTSLSAIASHITKTRWSGTRFFWLNKKDKMVS